MSAGAAAPTVERVEQPVADEDVKPDRPWVTIVWNDPVNLMTYVTYVFQKLFGYSKAKAQKLMRQVHEEGSAVVSSGTREQMEHAGARLPAHGLWGTLSKDYRPKRTGMASIKRKGDVIRLKLEPEERMILGGFAREVSELLGGVAAADPDPLAAMVGMGSETPTAAPDDPALRRLLPDAYDDPAGAAEFRRLTDDELRRGKTSALTRLADDVENSDGDLELDDEGADIWVQALNDVRLVLGVRLDVDDDAGTWRRTLTPDDPRNALVSAFDWLTGMQEMLLAAMRR